MHLDSAGTLDGLCNERGLSHAYPAPVSALGTNGIPVALGGDSTVIQAGSTCRPNREDDFGVDTADFAALAARAQRHARAGDVGAAASLALRASELYRGDLHVEADRTPHALLERVRLRVTWLSMLALLADDAFARSDFSGCLEYALRLLEHDPYREDAHRLVMRCYVRQGEPTQALLHFGSMREILRVELEAEPEPATMELYEQVRSHPVQ